MIFRTRTYRYHFRALDSVVFPRATAGNTLRGAIGHMLREEGLSDTWFRGRSEGGPSGLADPPRPFVLRAGHLDGRRVQRGEEFRLGVHEFDIERPMAALFERALGGLATAGLGITRGRVQLLDEDRGGEIEAVDLSLAGTEQRARVRFVTPIELKGEAPEGEIPFGLLFARVRDRVATLSRLYGGATPDIDYAGMGARAALIETVSSSLVATSVSRKSSRTGQTHGIGGMTGTVEYTGELGEFLPWLRAAWWTGVGRHTVWGNGVIEVDGTESRPTE